MNRRDVLTAAGGVVALSAAVSLADKAAKAAAPTVAGAPAMGNKALIEAAEKCLSTGEACLEHCVRTLSSGDKSMAECAATVRQMLPLCESLAQLARQDSKHLKALAAVCAAACRDCEAACKKHQNHHVECKACMESCQACAAECEKLA
ncbi:MAG: four-helix bundle copper-binding protein [Archangium sp.]|nr:four-helix bundle copper-binding protein [Archangium sp.]